MDKKRLEKYIRDMKNSLINTNNMNIDTGLYFGRKDSFADNQNIVISGMTNDKNQTIRWEITKL